MTKYYNIVDTADLLGIKVKTVRSWIKNGKLRGIKYPSSNRWYIAEDEIKRVRGDYEDGKK